MAVSKSLQGAVLYDDSGNAVAVVLDGSVYRLETVGKVLNASGAQINPATQETLAAIKDTDGVKKIVDALPAGANEIGKVAQGTKAAGSGAWPTVLYDASGNVIDSILDNSIRRLQTRGPVVGQTAGAGAEKKVTVIDDVTTATHKRLQVEADIKPGATIAVASSPGAPEDLFVTEAKNAGSPDMNVDGSGTPVVFNVPADATNDIQLREFRFIISGPKTMKMDGATFGEGAGLLTNGILIEAIVNNGITVTLANIRRNEGFAKLTSSTGLNFLYSENGVATLIVSSVVFGGRTLLKAGTGDQLKITIRDDLTSGGARKVKFFQAVSFGVFE